MEQNEKITIKDLKDYLEKFNENDNVSLIVVDSNKRLHYKAREIFFISDTSIPAIVYDINESKSFDEEENI